MMLRVCNTWLLDLSNVGRDNHADIAALSQYQPSMLEPPRWPSHELHVTTLDNCNVPEVFNSLSIVAPTSR